MIRFIVSNIDGTLLQDGATAVSERIIEQIRDLKEKGILFGIASSRDFDSVRMLLNPVKNDILYITNNGAVVIFDEEIIWKATIERRLGLDIVKDIESLKECCPLVSGEKTTYIRKKDKSYAGTIKGHTGYELEEIEEVWKVREDFTRISVYCKNGVTQELAEYLFGRWGKQANVTISGMYIIDITNEYANKGNAIAVVQHLYEISEEDTMTFGENYNDIEMFERSYFSYAMQDSELEIRKSAKHIAPNVETILDDVIRM